MNKVSRPMIFTLIAVLLIAVLAFLLASGHVGGDHMPSLMFFDEDLSDSVLGWAIAIPVLLFVGVVVAAICAGAALITVVALIFAAVLVVFALALAFTPFALFLAIPVLAVYGLVKLFQRDAQQSRAA